MIFIFKRKEIVLDCFTTEPYVYNFNKIDSISDHYPLWLKNTKKDFDLEFYKYSTIKKCIALIEMYKHGAVIPMWSDFALSVQDKQVKWQFADNQTGMESHENREWETFANPNQFQHFKIISPWFFNTKKLNKFYWTKPFWNFPLKSDYEIATGIIDFKYNHATNINFFIDHTKNNNILIKAQTPLIHIIPLSDYKLVIKNHLVDNLKELKFLKSYTFQNSYTTKKLKDIKDQKKCPFGFN
jgi:hypothetical protein